MPDPAPIPGRRLASIATFIGATLCFVVVVYLRSRHPATGVIAPLGILLATGTVVLDNRWSIRMLAVMFGVICLAMFILSFLH